CACQGATGWARRRLPAARTGQTLHSARAGRAGSPDRVSTPSWASTLDRACARRCTRARAGNGRREGVIGRMNADWFKDAVIYELHVRAFMDSNDDGRGDFDGLTAR